VNEAQQLTLAIEDHKTSAERDQEGFINRAVLVDNGVARLYSKRVLNKSN
jgi:hypothetical protein